MTEQQRPRGRRTGGEGAREQIITAAWAEFGERGYDHASVRGLSRRADVDPALVRYYFPGGKAEIFATALTRTGVDPARLASGLVAGGLPGLGRRLVETVLGVFDVPGGREGYRLALAAAAAGSQGPLLRDFLTREIFSRIAALMDGPDVELRVNLAASHVLGILVARYVLVVEPLASTPAAQIADRAGPLIQRYLDGAAADPGEEPAGS